MGDQYQEGPCLGPDFLISSEVCPEDIVRKLIYRHENLHSDRSIFDLVLLPRDPKDSTPVKIVPRAKERIIAASINPFFTEQQDRLRQAICQQLFAENGLI